MTDLQKSMYITGIGFIEGGSEVIGGFATSRLVKVAKSSSTRVEMHTSRDLQKHICKLFF